MRQVRNVSQQSARLQGLSDTSRRCRCRARCDAWDEMEIRRGGVSEVSEVWCGAGADADGDRGEGIVCSPFCRVRVVDGWINYIAGERADEAARVGPGREPMLIIDVGPGWQTLGAAEREA